MNPMDLSVVIVNWNTRDLLLDCLASVREHLSRFRYEVWVVDNASTDDSVPAVRSRHPEVKVIVNEANLGFAAANNLAFRKMAGRYALMLNTDTILTAGAIDQLHAFLETHPRTAMVCGQLQNSDGSRQNSIANFPSVWAMLANETLLRTLFPKKFPSKRRRYLKPIPVDSCIGACMLVRQEAMNQVGLLDEDYFFYFEETDWAYRMRRQGWEISFIPTARICHLQGQTAGFSAKTRIMFHRSRLIFFRKWHPGTVPFLVAVVFFRLLIDLGLNGLGSLLTLGSHKESRARVSVYSQVALWYLRGCPPDRTVAAPP
jgi:GT2 family glycosyltransferase